MAIMCCSQLKAINGSGTTKTMYGYTNSNILAGSGRSSVVAVVDKNGYTRYYPFYWDGGGMPSGAVDTGFRMRTSDSFTGKGIIVYPNIRVRYCTCGCSMPYGVSCVWVYINSMTVDLNASMCNCVDLYLYGGLCANWYLGRLGAGATSLTINRTLCYTQCSGHLGHFRAVVLNRNGGTVTTCCSGTIPWTCSSTLYNYATCFGNASQWGT